MAPTSEGSRLGPVDRAWLRMDDPTNLMMINGVLAFDRPLDMATLQRVIEERLLPIPRFRQRLHEGDDGHTWWRDDPDFEIDAHLSPLQLPAGEEDESALRSAVSELMSRPLDYTRPLWQFHLVERYKGGSALLTRLHHSIGDGIALMTVLLSLTELSAGDGDSEPDHNPFSALFRDSNLKISQVREKAEEMMPEGMKLMLAPADALKRAGKLITGAAAAGALGRLTFRWPDPRTVLKGGLGVEKRVAWSAPISMQRIHTLRGKLDSTVTDLLLTAVAGGLRRYLKERGAPTEGIEFRAAVPVNLRPLERMAELGNEFGLVFLPMPVGVAEPAGRLAALQQSMRRLKRSAEPLVVLGLLRTAGRAPKAVQDALVRIFGSKATAVMTSVPGPSKPLFLAGRRITELFFWVPQAGRLGLGVSILTYAGEARLGIATDAGLIPDPERIVAAFEEELAVLEEVA